MLRDVAVVRTLRLCPGEEALDRFARRHLVEIARQVDHAAQMRWIAQHIRRQQFARLGDRGMQELRRQIGAVCAGDPDRIAAGHLAAVHAADLAELDPARRNRRSGTRDQGPARRRRKPRARHVFAAAEIAERRDRRHAIDPHRIGRRADLEAGDDAGGDGIGERQRLRIEPVQGAEAEGRGQQATQRRAVIDVQPFRRGDEAAEIARPGELERSQKEMQMQSGEPAGGDAEALRRRGIPILPFSADGVMAEIRRVADEERAAGARVGRHCAVITDQQGCARHQAAGGQIGAQHQTRDRIDLDPDQSGIGESGAPRPRGNARTRRPDRRCDPAQARAAFRSRPASPARLRRAYRWRRAHGASSHRGFG